MKNKMIDLLKGIPIGLANVVPGFSGGTMALILNVYERLINAFSSFFKNPLKTIKELWALALGITLGIIIAIKLLFILIQNFPIPTSMFFVGLIIGSIPNIFHKTKKYKITLKDAAIFFVCVITVIVVAILKEGNAVDVTFNLKTAVVVFFLSILASATMVIPGVSGSMILLAIGYYNLIWIDIVGSFVNSLTSFDIKLILNSFISFIPFGLGIIIGVVLISKLIQFLLSKRSETVYLAILGLLIASPFAIMIGIYKEYSEMLINVSPISWVIGFLTLATGAYLVNYLSKYDNKNKKKIEIESNK